MRTATIEVRLLDEIEGTLALDLYDRSEIAAIAARVDAHEAARTDPERDEELCEATRQALDGGWLHFTEVLAIQRLRGWHRTRAGRIMVDGGRLWDAYRALGNLTLSLGSECEDEIRELEYPGNEDILAAARASMAATGYCGECQWCTVMRLRSECGRELHAAGDEMGIEYRTSVLGQSVARANREMYGYCMICRSWYSACTDPEHLKEAS